MIKITDKAAKKLEELRNSENFSSKHNVRVNVKGGGCSGLLYDLKFDDKTTENDQFLRTTVQKLQLQKSLFYILGTELDFSDGLMVKDFNQKILTTRTCGWRKLLSLYALY